MPNANQLPPEIQKIREVVAVFLEDFGADIITAHQENPISHPTERYKAFERLRASGLIAILSKLDELDVVVLDKDQRRPDNPYPLDYKKLPAEFQDEATGEDVYLMASNGFEKGIRYMKRDKWHKVVSIVTGTPKEG